MKPEHGERESARQGAVTASEGDERRRPLIGKWGGSQALKALMLVLLVAAGAWALYANLRPARPAMDMSAMRVTSGNTPFPVTLAPVERGPISAFVTYTGSVAPFNEEDVYPRVTGRIVEMPVYPGDAVQAGQVVARLDSVELTSRVAEAEAGLAAAQGNRAQMEADLTAAQHAVVQMQKELAMVDAELTYMRSLIARTERLFTSGAVSRQEYESDRAMATSAEAKRDAAQAKLELARAAEVAARKKLEAADSMVAQARASLRTASIVRDYVNIVAPNPGYVVKRLVAPGVLVQPGMAILKIAQIDRVRLQANVGEKDLASIRVGSPVTVITTAVGPGPFTARGTAVFPFVDQGPRTAVVEALVANPGRRLLPGQYVSMQFVTGERSQALTVPIRAVVRMGANGTVWVVKGERVEPQTVTTGLEGPERVEITQGLTGDERVVIRGHEGLYAGARVSDTATSPSSHQEASEPHGSSPRGLRISLSADPPNPRVGKTQLRIQVKDAEGAPVQDAKVEVTAGMQGMPGPNLIARASRDAGTYEATVNLGMAGVWTVEVRATSPRGGTSSSMLKLEAKRREEARYADHRGHYCGATPPGCGFFRHPQHWPGAHPRVSANAASGGRSPDC